MDVRRFIFSSAFVLSGSVIHSASFDCKKSSTAIEKTICESSELSGLDSRLDGIYKAAFAAADSTGQADLLRQQREWIKSVRNNYRDSAFMTVEYEARIDQLLHPAPLKTVDMQERPTRALDFEGLQFGRVLEKREGRQNFPRLQLP